MAEKVVVGLSGGVDSSVAALQLLEQGYDVMGLFMKNWEEDDGTPYCTAKEDYADAQAVCDRLQISLNTVNFSDEYWDHVFEVSLREYQAGRTPNPDVLCNQEIKFKAFLHYAKDLGADSIATGHYARIEKNRHSYFLLKGTDKEKDQSYFLYTLNQFPLSCTLFPLGAMQKSEVRRIAEKMGFHNAHKPDSTGICFIGERRFKEFLQRYLPIQPGNICTLEGKVIGQHEGLMYYTLGQRRGCGIGGVQGAQQEPWYVLRKDWKRNVLIVGQGGTHPALYASSLLAGALTWCDNGILQKTIRCTAKTRYRQSDQICSVEPLPDNRCRIVFDTPQRAMTPGQAVVLYEGEYCLGGGIIEEVDYPVYPI